MKNSSGFRTSRYQFPGHTTTGQLLDERLSRDGYRQNVRFRVQNFTTVAEVVSNSNLLSTLSRRFVAGFLNAYPLTVLELPIRLPTIRNAAFWHERMQSDARNRWFRKILFDAARTHVAAADQGEFGASRPR